MFKAYFSQILIVSLREKCSVVFSLKSCGLILDFAPIHDVKWGSINLYVLSAKNFLDEY